MSEAPSHSRYRFLTAIFFALIATGLLASSPSRAGDAAGEGDICLFVDFDDDDDPWTIDPEASESTAEFKWVFECQVENPTVLEVEIHTHCCGGVDIDFRDFEFNPVLVERALEITTRPISGNDCWRTGVFMELVPGAFVVGERYFLATGLAEGRCSSCDPEDAWFRSYAFGEECEGAYSQALVRCLGPADTETGDFDPQNLMLAAPQPNPATEVCTIQFNLPHDGLVELAVVDAGGRLVATPISEHRVAGRHSLDWSGHDRAGSPLSSGVYYLILRSGREESRAPLVWLR